MSVSQRAYARQRNVSEAAVRKAVKAGRITTLTDGSIDPAAADRQWDANTNVRIGNSDAVPQSTSGSLLQARAVHEVVKVQTSRVRLSKLKGDLIDRNEAISKVFKLARVERDAWLNWPMRVAAEMAASLGVDQHKMHIALDTAVREHLKSLGSLQASFE